MSATEGRNSKKTTRAQHVMLFHFDAHAALGGITWSVGRRGMRRSAVRHPQGPIALPEAVAAPSGAALQLEGLEPPWRLLLASPAFGCAVQHFASVKERCKEQLHHYGMVRIVPVNSSKGGLHSRSPVRWSNLFSALGNRWHTSNLHF